MNYGPEISATLHPARTPVAPVQHLPVLAPLVQDLPAKDIVGKRAVAPVLAQCPAADFQQVRHFLVAQISVLFWQNPPSLEMPSVVTYSRSIRSWRTTSARHPLSSIRCTWFFGFSDTIVFLQISRPLYRASLCLSSTFMTTRSTSSGR